MVCVHQNGYNLPKNLHEYMENGIIDDVSEKGIYSRMSQGGMSSYSINRKNCDRLGANNSIIVDHPSANEKLQ